MRALSKWKLWHIDFRWNRWAFGRTEPVGSWGVNGGRMLQVFCGPFKFTYLNAEQFSGGEDQTKDHS